MQILRFVEWRASATPPLSKKGIEGHNRSDLVCYYGSRRGCMLLPLASFCSYFFLVTFILSLFSFPFRLTVHLFRKFQTS